ncbi:hypothetical protein [Gynuella sunshinyii]|uniref:hypothetical protein n=1 Tax=Gynuella sunshinyii TaxID=1445505 RepID=UPI00146FE07E|nr:hypothetical protein [Gynuella sunshinyii]
MGLFDKLVGGNKGDSDNSHGLINSGRNKNTGGHDHRTNTGDDRTPSQKVGDKKRRKD